MVKKKTRTRRSSVTTERRMPTFLALDSLKGSPLGEDDRAFRTIIENLPVMCYVTEPTPPYAALYISPDLESFGYSLEEWQAGDEIWKKIVHPDDKATVWAEAEAARTAGRAFDLEYRLVNTDGTIHWVRDRSHYIMDDQGQKVCCLGIIVDITERRATRLKLVESEERYKRVFEDANDIIYLHDLQGNYIWMNRAAERILGYKPEEALQMHIRDITAPEQYGLAKEMLRKKLTGESEKTAYEVECVAKDGRRITLEVNTSVIRENGVPFAVQGIARDVTERKVAQAKLHEIEDRFQKAFENTNDIVYNYNNEGRFTWISQSVERILGYTPAEILSMNVLDIVAPNCREQASEMIRVKVENETERTDFEIEFVAKGGRRVFFDVNSSVLFVNDRAAGVQGIARDITDRKIAERRLLESEERYRKVFEDANDIVYNYDLDGNFIWVSRSVERILGYSTDEILAKRISDLVAPDQLPLMRAMTNAKLLGGEKRTEYEIDALKKDGTRVTLEINSSIISQDGTPIGMLRNGGVLRKHCVTANRSFVPLLKPRRTLSLRSTKIASSNSLMSQPRTYSATPPRRWAICPFSTLFLSGCAPITSGD